jgi:hypothetical protein
MNNRHFTALLGAIAVSAASLSWATEPDAALVSTFKNFVQERGLSDRWVDGALRQIGSAELNAAYPGREFVFSYQAAPVPPGAPLPELIERYQAKVAEHQKHSLRLTVGIDAKRNASAYQEAKDFNTGLMPVRDETAVKVATAAILSLIGDDDVYPEVIRAKEVIVTTTRAGWIGKASRPQDFDGEVVFDGQGQVVSATKKLNYVPPMPP